MKEPDDQDPLIHEVRRRKGRHEAWLREGDMSVGRRLAQIGVLGWIVVLPMLGGLFVGRALDHWLQTGIFWSAPLMMLGLAAGAWFAWKWMKNA
jgi:ATP synthase protein I